LLLFTANLPFCKCKTIARRASVHWEKVELTEKMFQTLAKYCWHADRIWLLNAECRILITE